MEEINSRTAIEMERGEVNKVLPAELVEKILAMVPFPYAFKAKALSKAWLARFSPISSLSDKEDKLLAKSFQNHVHKASTKWPTFSPVCTTYKDLFGYDQVARKWQRLPSSLPLYDYKDRPLIQIEGALLYGFHHMDNCLSALWEKKQWEGPNPLPALPNAQNSICVANILTGEWTQLPPLPNDDLLFDECCLKLVNDTSLGTYKIIAMGEDSHPKEHDYSYSWIIYDSKSETWSSNKFCRRPNVESFASLAYLNGIFYMVQWYNWATTFAYNVEEGSMEECKLEKDDEIDYDGHYPMLAVFNGSLVMIMLERSMKSIIHVLQIDLELQRLREVARCDYETFQDIINRPISDNNCIFYKMRLDNDLLLTYDQQKDSWSFFLFPCNKYS